MITKYLFLSDVFYIMQFAASKKVKMLVQTIEKKVVKSAKIPRNQLSRRLSEFCGDYIAYKMERITVDDVAQFSISRESKIHCMLIPSESKCSMLK